MLERRAGGGADVLEDHAVNEALVLLQIDESIAIDPEDFANVLLAVVGHGDFVDFIWIKPNLAFPTLQNASGKPLLELQRHHLPVS